MAAQRAAAALPLERQPRMIDLRLDSYEDTVVLTNIVQNNLGRSDTVKDPTPPIELKVEGGTLYLVLAAVKGDKLDDIIVAELLSNYLIGTRLYWFKARRSDDGKRKKLRMRPPMTHKIRLSGKRVWVKEFNWRSRYLIVGA